MSAHNDSPDDCEILRDWFAASEALYWATMGHLEDGQALPEGERTPTAIAFETVMTAAKHGVACPQWAASVTAERWHQFESFRFKSIGEAFEIPDHKHMHAKRDRLLCAVIYRHVRALQDQGYPLKDNAQSKGALSLVGERFHMSGSKVEFLMKEWKDLCMQTGSDPDDRPAYANPRPVIAKAIARALKPTEPKS